MAKQKACKNCKFIYEGSKCPRCGSQDSVEGFKGRIAVLNPQESEIAKNLKVKEKGEYAVKA